MDIPSTAFQGQEDAPVSFPLWIFNKRSRSKQGGLIPWVCKGSCSLKRGNFAYSSFCVVSGDVFFAGINWHEKSIQPRVKAAVVAWLFLSFPSIRRDALYIDKLLLGMICANSTDPQVNSFLSSPLWCRGLWKQLWFLDLCLWLHLWLMAFPKSCRFGILRIWWEKIWVCQAPGVWSVWCQIFPVWH